MTLLLWARYVLLVLVAAVAVSLVWIDMSRDSKR